jgi:hypothetical protein
LSRLGDYIDQMLTAANDAHRFIDGMSKEDFLPISEPSRRW